MNNDRIENAKANRAKARELLELTSRIKAELNEALHQLNSAGNWGIWDMLGGGMISNIFKHSRIGGAMECLNRAKPMMRRLSNELGELQMNEFIGEPVSGFAVFADFFFDGLFADLYMQSKIREFQRDVRQAISELDRIDSTLRRLDEQETKVIKGME